MIYRRLDEYGDYTFGRRNAFASDIEAVAQAVKTRILHFKGEWWENNIDGTPFVQEVAGQFLPTHDNSAQIDLVFSERIIGTQGVTEITEFDSTVNPITRTYSAQITISTIYGAEFQIIITGANAGLNVALQGGG
jgi:hypothetical protein